RAGERFGEDPAGGVVDRAEDHRVGVLPGRGGEDREDAAAHPARAHPRQIEVAVLAPRGEPRVSLAGQGVVVSLKDVRHQADIRETRQNDAVPIADKAARARSFGAVADRYQRGRAGYTPETIAWLLGPGPLEVLDLGAGTGKLTAALLAAGHSVTALEPSAGEREGVGEPLGGAATVVDGRAEEIPLADGSVDAVLAGSAFHWFDRDPT